MVCSLSVPSLSQSVPQSPETRKPDYIDRAIELAANRKCEEALPKLIDSAAQIADKDLKYRALMATARCGIRMKDGRATVNALLALRHDFGRDPEVLYLTTQVFLRIAIQASQDLTAIAPDSYQVLELQAESFESQGQWKQAADTYRKILEGFPKLPEIHLRLGVAILSQPESAERTEEAKKNFEQEMLIDPSSVPAEYWLGQIDSRSGQWEQALVHLNRALALDPGYAPALLGLGLVLNSSERFSDAIAPLERYTTLMPDDLTGHYQLAQAYRRSGRKEDFARESLIHQQLHEKKLGSPAPHN